MCIKLELQFNHYQDARSTTHKKTHKEGVHFSQRFLHIYAVTRRHILNEIHLNMYLRYSYLTPHWSGLHKTVFSLKRHSKCNNINTEISTHLIEFTIYVYKHDRNITFPHLFIQVQRLAHKNNKTFPVFSVELLSYLQNKIQENYTVLTRDSEFYKISLSVIKKSKIS